MPSDAPARTARCYCGAIQLAFSEPLQAVAYCHCSDCRRWTGAPVAAFAAFDRAALTATPALGPASVHTEGVERWNCRSCGSPLAAQFDYLPTQIYVPLGLFDQIDEMSPELHCHAGNTPTWLNIHDNLLRERASGRVALRQVAR